MRTPSSSAARRLLRVGHAQALDVARRARSARARPGPTPSTSSTLDAHPEDGRHDVREHHRRVDVVAAHRLEGHLGAELRLRADLEERVLLADLAVLRQRPARLAHEPDRRPLDRLAAGGAHEKRGIHGRRLAAQEMPLVGEHAVPKGPLAVRWLACEVGHDPGRRARARARRARERGRSSAGRSPRIRLAYHWLDELGNPIHWDGLHTHAPASGRARRAARGDARRARADPAGALPDRVRPRRRGHVLVQRGREPRAGARVAVQPRIERALAAVGGDAETANARSPRRRSRSSTRPPPRRSRTWRRAACPRRTGRGASSTPTRRATGSSAARVAAQARAAAQGPARARAVGAGRRPRHRRSRTRSSARRSSAASTARTERSGRGPPGRRAARGPRPASRGSTTGASRLELRR